MIDRLKKFLSSYEGTLAGVTDKSGETNDIELKIVDKKNNVNYLVTNNQIISKDKANNINIFSL